VTIGSPPWPPVIASTVFAETNGSAPRNLADEDLHLSPAARGVDATVGIGWTSVRKKSQAATAVTTTATPTSVGICQVRSLMVRTCRVPLSVVVKAATNSSVAKRLAGSLARARSTKSSTSGGIVGRSSLIGLGFSTKCWRITASTD